MPRANLTARKVASLKAPEGSQIDYWDTNLPGFGIRVSYGGRKSWIVMYRVGPRKRRLTLGNFPPMGLAEARKEAKTAQLAAANGSDPAAEKISARKIETFKHLAERYIENYAKPNKKSWRLDEKALQRDVVPRLGNYRIVDIKKRDIRDILDTIKDRGAPIQANRTFEVVRRLFNWAVAQDFILDTPCRGIEKPAKENQRERVLRENEIRTVWAAFDEEPPLVAAIYKLRLVTAQRGGEIMGMTWGEIDFATGWWTIPAERAKNGLTHRVPLSPMAVSIIERLGANPDDDKTAWLFPSPKPGRHIEHLVQATDRIRKRSGVEFVPHDLRRTAASFMTGMGIPRLTVSKILNHMERDVTRVYDRHSYDKEKQQALNSWGRRLEDILAGNATSAGNVVGLADARGQTGG